MKTIYRIVDRMGKVRTTYCMRKDAEYALKTEYKGCKIQEVNIK